MRKRYHYRVVDADGGVYIDRSSVPNRFTALRYACQEICDRAEKKENGLREFSEVLDHIRSREWEEAVKAFNVHPDAEEAVISIHETVGVHPGGYKAKRNHTNITVPSPAPTQEEIGEGNLLEQEDIEVMRYDVNKGHTVSRGKESGFRLFGPARGKGRAVLAESTSQRVVFEKMRKSVDTALLGYRTFAVNDHGNVTEYDDRGRVIGEWV